MAMRLKHVARVIAGQAPAGDAVVVEGSTPFLQGCAEFGEKHPSAKHYCEAPSKLAPRGAWLMSVRAPVGELNFADQQYGIGRGLAAIVATKCEVRFLGYSLLHARRDLGRVSTGSTYDAVSASQIGNLTFPLPDLDTQKAIADFLDRETARINQLIEKRQRFFTAASSRIEALVDRAISDADVPRVRFANVVRRMQRRVVLSKHDELIRLGLYNRGRGIFKKAAADEEGMGDSDFFFVKEGDLILSGQFAWEGAVAMATASEEGCVVSHRYPVFRGRAGVNTAYLLGLLRSSFGDFLLNEASRGSAGRNRPLNTSRLGKEKIPLPEASLQDEVERAVIFERRLKKKTEQSISRLAEFRAALITAAVTGEIDVATWERKGQINRRLDEIQEAMRA